MNKPWPVVTHVSSEGPALVGTLLAERGFRYTEYPMYRASELPAVHDIGSLVVMGGPMGALDDVTHPQLPRERNFIKKIVDAGLPMLGICLGAQLLAASFGSAIRRGPDNGAGTVTVSDDGTRDPVCGAVGAEVPVVHWYGDTFDLPGRRGPVGEQPPLRESGVRDRSQTVRPENLDATTQFYGRAFRDLDAHVWKVTRMDPSAVPA